jgi:hypothetical protein
MRDALSRVWGWYWGLPGAVKVIIAAVVAAVVIQALR